MALKRNERYPLRFANPTPAHPQGAFKNRTSPTSQDGSYLESDWANDWDGFFARLLTVAGVTANGNVDTGTSSQYYDALVAAIKSTLGTAAQRDVGDINNRIPDMSYFTGVREGKGYQKIPGGMIMQWGRVNVVTANTSADVIIDQFKIPFPGAALQCFATTRQSQVNFPSFACADAINPNEIRIQAVAIDITNKTITQGQIVPVAWFAIGY